MSHVKKEVRAGRSRQEHVPQVCSRRARRNKPRTRELGVLDKSTCRTSVRDVREETNHALVGVLRLPIQAVARSARFGKFEIKIRMIWSMSPRHKPQKPNCHKRFAHSAARRTRSSVRIFEESCRAEVRRAFGFSLRTASQSEHQVDPRKSLIIETEIRKSVQHSPMALQGVDRAFQRPSRRTAAQMHSPSHEEHSACDRLIKVHET